MSGNITENLDLASRVGLVSGRDSGLVSGRVVGLVSCSSRPHGGLVRGEVGTIGAHEDSRTISTASSLFIIVF